MSDYEHGDSVTLEVDATVIEEFDDGMIDVHLDGRKEATLGGVNLLVSPDEIKD